MAIIIDGVRKNVIDRTIPEIAKKFKNFDYEDISYFLRLLHGIGIDLFEIDKIAIDKIGKFPSCLNYVYRIETVTDLQYLNKYDFKYIVLKYKNALENAEEYKYKLRQSNIILEVDIDNLNDFYMNKYNNVFCIYNISCLRINSVNKINFSGMNKLIRDIGSRFSVLMDFCASNEYYMATAVALDALAEGIDMITTEFNSSDYASTEEVILALKVIKNARICGNLKLISQITKIYEKITKKKLYSMKPILGKDIFKYESGIHADGIAKNPKNYEPFDPDEIGAHRKLYIGKHSGKRALMMKFKELNLDYNSVDADSFLDNIRGRSVKMKKSILDREIIEMYNICQR